MANMLSSFNITPSDDGYLVTIAQEGGETVEFIATFDQLDVIAEAIDEVLDSDEEEELGVEPE